MHAQLLDLVQLFAILWACQDPLFMGFSMKEYWSGLPFPSSGVLSNPGIEPASPVSPALQKDSLPTEPSGKLWQGSLAGCNPAQRDLSEKYKGPSGMTESRGSIRSETWPPPQWSRWGYVFNGQGSGPSCSSYCSKEGEGAVSQRHFGLPGEEWC